MTEEHVIPRAIGGRDDFVIDVCKSCNDCAGHGPDADLTKCTELRLFSFHKENSAKRGDRQRGDAILKDGRTLDGIIYWERTPTGGWTPAFEVDKKQKSGEVWLDAVKVSTSKAHLDKSINILDPEMIEWIGFTCLPLEEYKLERAVAKIMLGTIYAIMKTPLKGRGFDLLRTCLGPKLDWRVTCRPAEQACARTETTKAIQDHLICYECIDGSNFYGGIELGTRVSFAITIQNFGVILPKRMAHIRNSKLNM